MPSSRDLAIPLLVLAAASLACRHAVTRRTAHWLPLAASAEARS